MKNRKFGMLCLCLSFCWLSSSAQNPPINEPDYNKPKLFLDLPERLDIRIPDMENLFNLSVGQSISAPITPNFTFNGQVVSVASSQENQLKSVVIRSTNRIGAALTFTRLKNADGTTKYLGRIISRNHGDGYEITFENGKYAFVKRGYYDLVSE